MAVLKDLIVYGSSRFLNGSHFNTINAESIGAEQGIFNKLIATTLDAKEATIDNLTAQNATVVGLLDVQGELHTNAWTNANIANIGGSFYISPTVEPTDGTTTISITRNSATSWTISATGTFATDFIKSGTATSGVAWPANSLVLITGDVVVNNMVYPLGTLKGTLSAQVTATAASTSKTITITGVTDAQNNNGPSVLQELYEVNNNTNISNAAFKKGKISLYKLGSNPIGILMTSMGTSSNSLIDVFGGTGTTPNVRIGHLGALASYTDSAGNTHQPTGWGIYTDNGYFKGVVVADSGLIGGFKIDSNSITKGSIGAADSVWMSTGTSSNANIAGSGSINGWAFTAGTTYGVTKGGALYAASGKIGGWTIDTNKIYSGTHSTWNSTAEDGLYLGNDGIAGGSGGIWYLWKDGSAKIGAMTLSAAGVLSVPAANITGTLTAGQIAANSINASKLSIGDWTNLATANEFQESSLPVNVSEDFKVIIDNGYLVKKTATNNYLMFTEYTLNSFKTGDELYFEFYGKAATAGNISVNVYAYDANKGYKASNGFTISLTTTEAKYSGTIALSNTNWDTAAYYLLAITDNKSTKSQIYVRKVIFRRKSAGELIVDGSINANKISVSTLSAISANMGTLTAGTISYGTVGSNESFYLSNTNKTATVAGASRANLRLSVGSGFGVDKDGKLYATGAIISGALTATSLTINSGATIGGDGASQILNSKIEVGGRNLARGTAIMAKGNGNWNTGTWRDSGASSTYNYTISDSPVPSVNKGILVTTATANTRYGVAQDGCPMLNKQITFSVWAKGTSGGTITLQSAWWSGISAPNWSKTFTANGNWQYLSFTTDLTNVTVPNNACSICYMYWTGVNANDSCIFIAPKLEYGNVATDWSTALEDLEVGTKNLLLGTSSEEVSFTEFSKDYNLSSSIVDIKDNDFITISFWAKASTSLWTDFYFNDGSSSWANTAYFFPAFQLTTSWQYFTYTGIASVKASTAKVLRFRQNSTEHGAGGSIGTVYVKKLKLEKGTVATEWDLASDCITEISNTGIWITPPNKRPTSTGGVVANSTTGTLINTDGVGIYNAGIKVAQYGTNALIGREASGCYNIFIDATDGITLRNNTTAYTTLTTNALTLGKSDSGHATVTSSGLNIYTGTESDSTRMASFGSTVTIGKSGAWHLDLVSDKINFVSNATTRMSIDSSNIDFGMNNAGAYLKINTNNGIIGGYSGTSADGEGWIDFSNRMGGVQRLVIGDNKQVNVSTPTFIVGKADNNNTFWSSLIVTPGTTYNGHTTTARGNLVAETDETAEAKVMCKGAGGLIYMYSATSENRGIYGNNLSNVSSAMIVWTQDYDVCNIYGARIGSSTGHISLTNGGGTSYRYLLPAANTNYRLGNGSFHWDYIFSNNSLQTSDLKLKEIIEDFDWKVDDFIRGLKPIAYRRIQEEGKISPRIGLGFGAQDVSKLSKDLNMGNLSVYNANIVEINSKGEKVEYKYNGEEIDDSKLSWSLNYSEFIAPMVLEIQRLMDRVDSLESEIKRLKS